MAPALVLAYQYTNEADVQSLLSIDGETGSLDDNFNGTVDGAELAFMTVQGMNWACDKVNFYCSQLYEFSDLATSWLVNGWATVLTCRWLRGRRGNPIPETLVTLYDEAIAEMKEVQAGRAYIPGLGHRNIHMPGYSNVYKDDRYWLRKLRVQRPLSDRQSVPAGYSQKIDRIADLIPEP